jgi:K+-transporting ATPase ATPase B chain
VLLLDKTGTITLGNRQATTFLPAPGCTKEGLADAAQLSSLADETPEGRSIVVLAKEQYGIRERDVRALKATFVPFTAQTRMSGVDLDGREIRKGAADAIEAYVNAKGGVFAADVHANVASIAKSGGTPLVVAEGPWRHSAQGHRQGRHQGALRRTAKDGHQDGDDHRRQSDDRGCDRRGVGGR